jgi:protein-S-isoprenylcysteine O-methyltransferase Ste14
MPAQLEQKTMNTFRYLVAWMLVTIVPPLLVYWLLVHLLIPVWRRLGVSASQYLLWLSLAALVILLSAWTDVVLVDDFGSQPLLVSVGVVLLAGAVIFRLQIGRYLSLSTQLGFPEIDPLRHPQKLLTEGPYAHLRHPRYVQVTMALAGWALLANYPAGYVAALLWIPLMLVIVRLEEAELLRRYGPEYVTYRERVARFWPHAGENHRVQA